MCRVIQQSQAVEADQAWLFQSTGWAPICVPGYHWLQVLVMGMEGPVQLAHLRWWTTRGERAEQNREGEGEILAEVTRRWGIRGSTSGIGALQAAPG